MTFFFTRIFSLILRVNAHISKNFLCIKILNEYGPELYVKLFVAT